MSIEAMTPQALAELGPEERRALLRRLLEKKETPTRAYPLSTAQKRMWLITEMNPNSHAYNILNAFQLEGDLSLSALERSIDRIVARHQALRTLFRVEDRAPVQIVLPSIEVPLLVRDFSALAGDERMARAHALSKNFAMAPFDLKTGPLLRLMLLRLSAKKHILLLATHHIVFDIWSMRVFTRELSAFYRAGLAGTEPELPALDFQFKDFALAEREELAGERIAESLSYWKTTLAGLETTELAPLKKRPPVQRFHGAVVRFSIPSRLAQKLQALGREHEASAFMTWLTVLQALLFRYSANADISVGVPFANRTRSETERLIGVFVNTLVMRADLSARPGFRELLEQVRQTALNGYRHAQAPFDRVVEALAPDRDLSRNHLVQIMFQTGTLPRLGLEGLTVTKIWEMDWGVVRGDLELHITDDAEPEAFLVYNTDLYSEPQMRRFADHFLNLAEAVAAQPDRAISALPMLTRAECETFDRWCANEFVYPETTLHAVFEDMAARYPDHEAVVEDKGRMSYATLNRRANRVADYLLKKGVRTDQRVGLMAENSGDLLIGILGILKAGGAYIPLDTRYPTERLRVMIDHAGIDVLLGRASSFDAVPDRLSWRFDPWREGALDGFSERNPPRRAFSDNLAYMNFTSGSTGAPKGSSMTHRNALRFVLDKQYIDLKPGDSMALIASSSWDVFAFEVWTALTSAARLCVFSMDDLVSVDGFVRRSREWSIDAAFITSPLFARHVAARPDIYAGIRYLYAGGDRVDPAAARLALEHSKPHVFYNGYGPTECATYATLHPISLEDADSGDIPLGRTIANTRAYVLDPWGNRAPIGVAGELFVGGHGLSRCYANRPRLTAERFLPDGLSGLPGQRLYRSGDLVRYREDGCILFLGRRDFQVKINGFRIELGEIENRLAAHPDVASVAVLALEHLGDKRLAAYLCPAPGREIEIDQIDRYARDGLPRFMAPSAYVVMERFPLTPNGKLNRRALPAPVFAASDGEYIAPRGHVQEILAALWAEIMELDRVGAGDEFFRLGGHSLLGTRVLAAVHETFHLSLELRVLFEHSVLEDFAAQIEKALLEENDAETTLEGLAGERDAPLSFGQGRLWFFDQLNPGNTVYLVPLLIGLKGELDRAALESAFVWLVERHESLRTSFRTNGGKLRQSSIQTIRPELKFADFSDHGEAEREAELQAINRQEAETPFDLAKPPLFRLKLVRFAAHDHLLVFTLHHILVDGSSTVILIRELAQAYAAYADGRTPAPPPLTVNYRDFTVWQRARFGGASLERLTEYWRERLKNAPVLELPSDHPRPEKQSYRGQRLPIQFSKSLSDSLKSLAADRKVSLYMVLLAAWQVLLARLAGQDDLVIGSPIEKRDRAGLAGVVGYFSDIAPMRADLSGEPSFAEFLIRVRRNALDAYANHTPFDKLIDGLDIEREAGRHPLYQVVLALNPPLEPVGGAGLEFETGLSFENQVATVDLNLQLSDAERGLTGYVEYNTDLFEQSRIDRMMRCLVTLLQGVAVDPDRALSRLPLLDETDRAQIMAWSGAAADYPADRCIHHLFEAMAERQPDALALQDETRSLTYRELDLRAARLAQYLSTRGFGPENVVAILLDRGTDGVVCALAALKAGGAFLPMDPVYPDERLDYMIRDADASWVLTDQSLSHRLPDLEERLILVDREAPIIDSRPPLRTDPITGPAGLAYVIYTSGSTGKPKGVLLPHGGLCNLVTNHRDGLGVDPNDRVLLFTSFAFDAAVSDIFMALANGAALFLMHEQRTRDPRLLLDYLDRERITIATLPPSIQAMLPESSVLGLRILISAGEATNPRLIEKIGGGLRYLNAYGPTECTVCATWTTCSGQERQITIGKPLANKQVFLLDRELAPVPIGAKGELVIGGLGLARGYRGQPERTAAVFTPHPFASRPGARCYKTGDLGLHHADGEIRFCGRGDSQLKIRGHRVELGEIEARLRELDAVDRAVVVARDRVEHGKVLAAYLETGPGFMLDAASIRARLETFLPSYMIPASFTALDVFPCTPNGKIDLDALPRVQPQQAESPEQTEPLNEQERLLAEVWSEVLGVTAVGPDDNFFNLGGDSILVIQLVSKARRHGLVLDPNTVFQKQTLAALAETIAFDKTVAVDSGPETGESPLLPIQHWFFEKIDTGRDHWNQSLLLAVADSVAYERVETVLAIITAHHDAFRLRYRQEHGVWTQTYAEPSECGPCFTLSYFDLSSQAPDELSAAIEQHANAVQTGMSLEQGPLLCAAWLATPAGLPDRLLLTAHHLIIDGVSWRILFEDLEYLVERLAAGEEPAPLPKTDAYRVWAERLREYARQPEIQAEFAFWLAQSNDAAPLPVDFPAGRDQNQPAHLETVTVFLEQAATETLFGELANRPDARINDLLLAALARALADETGQSTLYLDLEGHGREPLFDDVDMTRTIGWFTSAWPLKLSLSGVMPEQDLKQIGEQLDAVPNKGLGYGLLRYLGEDQGLRTFFANLPEPEISFNYLGRFDQTLSQSGPFSFTGETAGLMHAPDSKRIHLIDVYALAADGKLKICWDYCAKLHRRETIEAYAARVIEALQALIDHCRESEPSEFAPADFGLFDTDADDLNAALAEIEFCEEGLSS